MFARIHVILLILAGLIPAAGYTVPKVVSTINPIHFLVVAVSNGVLEPVLPSTGTSCVHDCAVKPSDVSKFDRADILFYIDEELEPFVKKLSARSKKKFVRLSDAVPLLASRSARDSGRGYDVKDFHIWLSPANAEKIIQTICSTLSDEDPENAHLYRQNTENILKKLDVMTEKITEILAPVKDVPYVVIHDAYQYFDRYFGLNFVAALSSGHTVSTTARALHAAKTAAKAHATKCIFIDNTVGKIGAALVPNDAAHHIYTVDPVGTSIAASENGYFELMMSLAEQFRECLSK
ncbi:metal ABC transporter solute-binding protein, Zn/Mn family [Anaplasma bovis]|uniref:metal ABC transporter solute-binding protein, Zn/Mn family n=1 Tax=Anaplasma bovis TaxID=186733 RepID=UPI002FF0ED7B